MATARDPYIHTRIIFMRCVCPSQPAPMLPTIFARRKLTKLVRELAEGKEPIAALQSEQYGLRAIAKVSPIADFDEFMKTHGEEGKAGTPLGSPDAAAVSAVH